MFWIISQNYVISFVWNSQIYRNKQILQNSTNHGCFFEIEFTTLEKKLTAHLYVAFVCGLREKYLTCKEARCILRATNAN